MSAKKRRVFRELTVIVFFFISAFSWGQRLAQTVTISGKITSSEDGEPLPGVSIIVKGTTKGTVSDFDGEYEIEVRQGQTLGFSYVGFKSKEILVEENEKVINVVLQEEDVSLEEVVLTGYRKVKSSQFAGSSVKLNAADVKVGGATTIDNLLQGQASGVSVQSTSAVFGTTPKIRIRGSSSITGINEPLWVLDGVELRNPLNISPSELYSGNARTLLSSALGGINPNDIEDITILKDASATALYGTRAVNGVIIITTKRAKRGKELSIDYTTGITQSFKPSIINFDVLNSADEIDIRRQLFNIHQARLQSFSAQIGGAYSKLIDQQNRKEISELQFRQGIRRIKNNNTDWFDVLFQNSIQQQHSISASYGGKKAVTRASLSYLGDGGYQLGQNLKRYTFTSSSKFFVSDKVSVESLLKYASRKQRNPGERVNPYLYASYASRAMSPYDAEGGFEYYKKDYVNFNIINEIDNDYIDINSDDLSLQLKLEYEPIDNLSFTLLANSASTSSELISASTENSAYANSYRTTRFRIIRNNERLYKDPDKPANALPETVLPNGGFLTVTNVRTRTNTFRGQVSWDALKSEYHKLDVFAGMEAIMNKSEETAFTGYGYIFSSGTPFPSELALKQSVRASGDYYATSLFVSNQLSFYGSLNYSLLDKYIVTGSLRNDATNISGTHSKNRFLPTWAFAVAWSLGKEPFMETIKDVLSSVKLRASYGLRGNAGRRGPDLVAYYQTKSRLFPEYNRLIIFVQEPENQDLEFEKEHIFSAGIDFSLFNLVDITAEYYHRKNFDLIGSRVVAPSLGYATKLLNWATMTNEGYEFSLSSRPIKFSKDFSWKGTFNIGYNKNIVVSNYIGNNPTLSTATRGSGYPFQNRPLTGLYAFQFAGLDNTGKPQYYNLSGEKVYGFVGGNRKYGNIAYQGSRDPLYSGGFNSSFTYKDFTLGASFVFNLGHVVRKNDFYRHASSASLLRDDLNITGDYKHRWRVSGNEQFTNIPKLFDQTDMAFYVNAGIFVDNAMRIYNKSDIRTVDASFLRIRTIFLKYAFPKRWAQNLKINYLTTELQITNPIVFASDRLRGQDPEALIQRLIQPGQDPEASTRGTNIPPVKSITFNLSLGF